MAKKSTGAESAYKSKGMKAPKPEAGPKLDQSSAPKTKPSMKHKEPRTEFKSPKDGEQSAAPTVKKVALPREDAPKGVLGVNEGSSIALPKSGGVGESEV